jgi:hypothetical protein
MPENTLRDDILFVAERITHHRRELAANEAKLDELLAQDRAAHKIKRRFGVDSSDASPARGTEPAPSRGDASKKAPKKKPYTLTATAKENILQAMRKLPAPAPVPASPPKRRGRQKLAGAALIPVKNNVLAVIREHGPIHTTLLERKVPHGRKVLLRVLPMLSRAGKIMESKEGWKIPPLAKA